MVAPVVAEIAQELEGQVKVCKLDVDEAQDIAANYGVASIPTLMVFKDGQVVKTAWALAQGRHSGAAEVILILIEIF
jgi:thioredoxin 1